MSLEYSIRLNFSPGKYEVALINARRKVKLISVGSILNGEENIDTISTDIRDALAEIFIVSSNDFFLSSLSFTGND